MSEELTLEKLNLKKPLDKMTAKELRELTIEKIPQITGASGMDKASLLSAIKELLGLEDAEGGVSPYKDQIRSLKKEIKGLRTEKAETDSRKERDIMRRKINRLKKRTRRLARSV